MMSSFEEERANNVIEAMNGGHNNNNNNNNNVVVLSSSSASSLEMPPSTTNNISSPSVKFVTDEPEYSSAALCITINHLNQKFYPVYTHQIIDGERFVGYQPLSERIDVAVRQVKQQQTCEKTNDDNDNARRLVHKSHENHTLATHTLDVQIALSPSCESCSIQLHTKSKQQEEQPTTTEMKEVTPEKQQLQEEEVVLSSVGEHDERRPEKRVKITVDGEEAKTTSAAPQAVIMSESDILMAVSKALPPIVPREEFLIDDDRHYLSSPVGTIIEEYTVAGKDFAITLGDGRSPPIKNYHDRVQKLALFYIENADDVDLSCTDNGYWKVMYLFQKHTTRKNHGYDDNNNNARYSLVGYLTLFHFIALFHKPQPGIIVRICQALVLPSYQGQGHGQRLMEAVYELAHQSNDVVDSSSSYDIVQVNVEDPAPAFVALRNKTDYQLCQKHSNEWDWPNTAIKDPNNFFTNLTESQAIELSAKAKITPRQIHIVHELSRLHALRKAAAAVEKQNQEEQEEMEKLFRLLVKRRLNKESKEDMLCLSTKEEKKAYLATLFDDVMNHYERIIKF
jgi:histone acetyltransferase 1